MAGCSKKQYAIMMSAGEEGKKLASEMGGMEQDEFNKAFSDLMGQGGGYNQDEDEDYKEFDPDSEDDYGFDDDDIEYTSEERSERLLNDIGEVTTDHYVKELERLREENGYKESNLVSKVAKYIDEGYGDEDSLQFAIDDYSKELYENQEYNQEMQKAQEENANMSDDLEEEPERKGLVKDTLVDKFNDAHLYNDGGKFQLALSNGETKEFDTKDEAIDYLSQYSKQDYSWAKDKQSGTEAFNELKDYVSKLSDAQKEMLKDLLNNPRE